MKYFNKNVASAEQGFMNTATTKVHFVSKRLLIAAVALMTCSSLAAQEAESEQDKKDADVERIIVTVERRTLLP